MTTILINNRFQKKNEAKISILSNAFMRGVGVFETMRTFDDKNLFREKDHINRLFKSAKAISLKPKYSKAETLRQLHKVVTKSPNKLQRIKIVLTEGYMIIVSTKTAEKKKLKKGVSCTTVECQRSLPKIKSISYLASYLSHEKAVKLKSYDAILIDKKGEVFEGAYSNIFWFEGDHLCTRENEVLEGITRKAVLEISPFKIRFKTIKIKELLKKQEVFLTQSTQGIVPIIKIDGKKIGKGKPGEKTLVLNSLLSKLQSKK
jgi:branched-chain amino acid aminotransferase